MSTGAVWLVGEGDFDLKFDVLVHRGLLLPLGIDPLPRICFTVQMAALSGREARGHYNLLFGYRLCNLS